MGEFSGHLRGAGQAQCPTFRAYPGLAPGSRLKQEGAVLDTWKRTETHSLVHIQRVRVSFVFVLSMKLAGVFVSKTFILVFLLH